MYIEKDSSSLVDRIPFLGLRTPFLHFLRLYLQQQNRSKLVDILNLLG